MLSQVSDEKIICSNLNYLNFKKAFLTNRDVFGNYLKSNHDFREFCSRYSFICDHLVVTKVEEIESFTNLVYRYHIKFHKGKNERRALTIYTKSYLPFTKGNPSYVFQENFKSRSKRESIALKELEKLDIENLVVPHVVSCDVEREILITLALQNDRKTNLLKPGIDLRCDHLYTVCSSLAELHSQTLLSSSEMFNSDTTAMESTLDFRGTLARKLAQGDSKFAASWQIFIKETISSVFCRLHGNLTPRNIKILGNSKFAFFDLEFSMYGDPAFDIGTILGHYVLEMISNPVSTNAMRDNLHNAWEKYAQGQSIKFLGIEKRMVKYIALTLLYRAWFEPSWHLDTNTKEKLTIIGIKIFDYQYLEKVLETTF